VRLGGSLPLYGSRVVSTSENGRFVFDGIPPGRYTITVEPNPLSLAAPWIVVVDRDVTGLELPAPATEDVKGRVTVDGGGPLPAIALMFAGPYGTRSVSVQRDGQFTVVLPLGEHRMVLSGVPSPYRIVTAAHGSTDLLVRPLTIDGRAGDDVSVVLGQVDGWRSIRGRLIDRAGSRTPPRVTASSPRLLQPVESAVGPGGTFEFPNMPPGTYDLQAVPGEPYEPVRVTVGDSDVTGVEVVRPRQVEITGRILVERDAPMPRPTLSFVRPHGRLGTAISNDGRFVTTLPEGRHHVIVTQLPPGYAIQSITAGTTDLLTEPLDVSDALPIEILVRVAVDASVQSVRVGGRVIGLEGSLTATTRVMLGGLLGIAPQESPIQADGSFSFGQVVPGRYTLQLTSSGGLPPPTNPLSLVVGGADVTGVELRTLPLAAVRGVIEAAGDAPLPSLSLGFSRSGGYHSANNLGGPRDTLDVTLPAGEYRVTLAGITTGYRLASLVAGDTDLLTQPLTVAAGTSVSLRARVETSLRFVDVSGRIVVRDGSDAMPEAIRLGPPSFGNRRTFSPTIGRPMDFGMPSVTSDVSPDGTFRFSRVPAGTYTADFVPENRGPRPVTVVVGSKDVEDFEILLPRRVDLTGRVRVTGGGPPIHPGVVLSRDDVAGELTGSAAGPDGTFRWTVPEGRYRISLEELPAGYVLESIVLGGRDITSAPLDVEPGMPAVTFTVQAPVPAPWRRVAGRVLNPANAGRTSSETLRLSDAAINQSREATIAPDGSFAFPAVLPGAYRVELVGAGTPSRVTGLPQPGDSGEAILRVSDADVLGLRLERLERLDVQASRSVLVQGRIVMDGPGPRPSFLVQWNGVRRSIGRGVDGSFSVYLEPGQQRLSITQLPDGFELIALRHGSVDLLQEPAAIAPGNVARLGDLPGRYRVGIYRGGGAGIVRWSAGGT
jgi:hypothetical protein